MGDIYQNLENYTKLTLSTVVYQQMILSQLFKHCLFCKNKLFIQALFILQETENTFIICLANTVKVSI